MSHKLGVCVPYRNRELHLNEFIPKVGKFLKEAGIDFQMYFAHQIDDKLFNRGAMKNIAAKHAFEDGCDYIVWHDIDMIPEDNSCDYSFPEDFPQHIAVRISQSDYKLKYFEYFGGAVIFSKEQVEKTNGYSNDYWDWGMEDDDLFWRCYLEGLLDLTTSDMDTFSQHYYFNGKEGKIVIPNKILPKGFFQREFEISVLARAEHQQDKAPIHLIGDNESKFFEYPIFRIPGEDFGISFNNSRAYTLQFFNNFHQHNYMWIKRYANLWTWITAKFNPRAKKVNYYQNGIEADVDLGHGTESPLIYNGRLSSKYKEGDIYLGYTPSFTEEYPGKRFKGGIGEVIIKSQGETIWKLSDSNDYYSENVEKKEEEMIVYNTIIPHRRNGKFRCLPHKDEGLVNGKWAKGPTTARNERRYVLEMQQGKYKYKNEGFNTLKYELVSEEKLTPWAKMLNVKL